MDIIGFSKRLCRFSTISPATMPFGCGLGGFALYVQKQPHWEDVERIAAALDMRKERLGLPNWWLNRELGRSPVRHPFEPRLRLESRMNHTFAELSNGCCKKIPRQRSIIAFDGSLSTLQQLFSACPICIRTAIINFAAGNTRKPDPGVAFAIGALLKPLCTFSSSCFGNHLVQTAQNG